MPDKSKTNKASKYLRESGKDFIPFTPASGAITPMSEVVGSFIPGISEAMDAAYMKSALQKGNYGEASLYGAGMMLPFVTGKMIKGLKSFFTPSKKFKSDIDWGKWNKEIPNNKDLLKEYHAIEEMAKKEGNWMKNPDGSAFKGTPEQFVQQQSVNFKKAFPEGFQSTYRGFDESLENAPDLINPAFKDKYTGVFTGEKHIAKGYGAQIYNVASKKSSNTLTVDGLQSNWSDIKIPSTKAQAEKGLELAKKSKENALKNSVKGMEPYDFLKNVNSRIESYENLLKNWDKITNDPNYKALLEYKNNNKFLRTQDPSSDFYNPFAPPGFATDDAAKIMEDLGLDNLHLKNIEDGAELGDILIHNQVPGNYLKSLEGNTGMFDMNNPDIYKKYGGNMKKFKYNNGGKTPKKKPALLQYDPSSGAFGNPAYDLDTYQKAITRDSLALEGIMDPGVFGYFGFEENPLADFGVGSQLARQLQINRSNRDQIKGYTAEDIQRMNYYMPEKPTTDFDEFLRQYQESGIDDRAYGGKAPKYPDGGKFDYNSIYEGQILPDNVDRSIPNTFYIQPFYNETTKQMMSSGEQGFQGPQKRFSKQELAKSLPNIGQHIESALLPIREKMLKAKTKEEYDSLQKEYNDLMPASNLSRGISNYLDSIAVQGFGFSKGDQVRKKQYGGEADVDYEAEGGEVVIGDISINKAYNGGMATKYKGANMYKLGGPSHADGGIGIKMNTDEPSYVFTDRLKVGGMKGATYADMASKFGNELDEISRMAMGGDVYDRNTAKRMSPRIMQDVKDLYDDQEAFKKEQGIDQKPDMGFLGGIFNVDPAAELTPPETGAASSKGGFLQNVFGKLGEGVGMTPGGAALRFAPAAFNIAKGLFGRKPEVDLGTYEPTLQDYQDFSPMEQRYMSQQDRALAGLRAGLEGSGATGAQLRAGLQSGTTASQQQAGDFYSRLGTMQMQDRARVDQANIAEINRAEQINQQIAAQEAQMEESLNPLKSLSKGLTQGLGTLTGMQREATQRGMLKGLFGDDLFGAYGGQFGLRKK